MRALAFGAAGLLIGLGLGAERWRDGRAELLVPVATTVTSAAPPSTVASWCAADGWRAYLIEPGAIVSGADPDCVGKYREGP